MNLEGSAPTFVPPKSSMVVFLAPILLIFILMLQVSELRLNLCELGSTLIRVIAIAKSQAVAARPVFDLKWTFWRRGIQ